MGNKNAGEASVGAGKIPAKDRTFSSSEVLFLEVIEVARRREWHGFATKLIKARANQQVLLLDYWLRSPTVEAMIEQDERKQVDNDAGDAGDLRARLNAAHASAVEVRAEMALLPANLPMASIDDAVAKLLAAHDRAMRTLPDNLREALDWDQADYHRRFMLAGTDVPNRHDQAYESVDAQLGPPEDELHDFAMAGLALSGGGVRSASFGLGALQALAQPGLIRVFDFVSGVSGGGWAAGWLAAWAHRHESGIAGVEEELFQRKKFDSAPLRWVRRHIAYLAPRPGLSSGDTWALLVAYASNWMPILVLVSLAIIAATLFPHLMSASANWLSSSKLLGLQAWVAYGVIVSIVLCTVLVRRLTLWHREPGPRVRPSPGLFLVVGLAALFGTVPLSLYFPMVFHVQEFDGTRFSVVDAIDIGLRIARWWIGINLLSVLIALGLTTTLGQYAVDAVRWLLGQPNVRSGRIRRHNTKLIGELLALLFSTSLFSLFFTILVCVAAATGASAGTRMAYGPLLIVLVFAIAELFGLMFTQRRDVDRAWVARIGAWIIAAILGWALLCTFALGITSLWRDPGRKELGNVIAAVTVGLLLFGAWLASKRSSESRNVVVLWACLAILTPALPIAVSYVVRDVGGHVLPVQSIGAAFATTVVLFWVLAAACNVNRFSLHAIYKEGLVRTFLGASRLALRNPLKTNGDSNNSGPPAPIDRTPFSDDTTRTDLRRPAPATNIDDNDDPALTWLASTKERQLPVLLFNAAVNGTSKTDVEGRAPRQWPFTFSQYFSGSPATGIGYAPTKDFFADGRASGESKGLTLGSAMAVSGAAMSPTSGNYTHPLRAFLLGALNARLGMWIGNPSVPKAVRRTKPTLGGVTILREMLGLRARFGDWIHLSDGGHFENLGVYELVRRGCLRIVAVDASCDPKRNFEDLADAIRRARIDLDVDIYPRNNWDIQAPSGASAEGGAKAWMWFEIDYGPHLPRGRMLYVKPSVYHHEFRQRPDVHNYWREVQDFPHESTMNQFFTERQMEAYRTLGESCMAAALNEVLGSSGDDGRAASLTEVASLGPVQVADASLQQCGEREGADFDRGAAEADESDSGLKKLIQRRW